MGVPLGPQSLYPGGGIMGTESVDPDGGIWVQSLYPGGGILGTELWMWGYLGKSCGCGGIWVQSLWR